MREPDRKRWEEGVVIDGVKTRPAEVFTIRYEQGKTWIEVTLYEGRNQQIRKMGDATGFKILRLARTSFAGITSEGLRPGDYRALTSEELMQLRETFGVPRRVSKRRDPIPTNATPVRGGRSPRAMTRGRRRAPRTAARARIQRRRLALLAPQSRRPSEKQCHTRGSRRGDAP